MTTNERHHTMADYSIIGHGTDRPPTILMRTNALIAGWAEYRLDGSRIRSGMGSPPDALLRAQVTGSNVDQVADALGAAWERADHAEKQCDELVEQLQDARIDTARIEGTCEAQHGEIVRANVDRDDAWQKIVELREQIATLRQQQAQARATYSREQAERDQLQQQLDEAVDAASLQAQIDRQAAALQTIAVHLGIKGEPTVEAIVAGAASATADLQRRNDWQCDMLGAIARTVNEVNAHDVNVPDETLVAARALVVERLQQRVDQLTEANEALQRAVAGREGDEDSDGSRPCGCQ